jgi:hypothetical protein
MTSSLREVFRPWRCHRQLAWSISFLTGRRDGQCSIRAETMLAPVPGSGPADAQARARAAQEAIEAWCPADRSGNLAGDQQQEGHADEFVGDVGDQATEQIVTRIGALVGHQLAQASSHLGEGRLQCPLLLSAPRWWWTRRRVPVKDLVTSLRNRVCSGSASLVPAPLPATARGDRAGRSERNDCPMTFECPRAASVLNGVKVNHGRTGDPTYRPSSAIRVPRKQS